jgi:O-antigen/teichoic acid export membrane protein
MEHKADTLKKGKRALGRTRLWRQMKKIVTMLGVITIFLGQVIYGVVVALLFAGAVACLYRLTEIRYRHWREKMKRIGELMDEEVILDLEAEPPTRSTRR